MRLEVDISPAVSVSNLPANSDPDSVSQAAKEALNVGIRQAQAGDRVNARIALLRAAEFDQQNESAWLWLASISEYPEELMAFLENVLDINPANERAVQWMSATKTLLAKTFLQRGTDAADADQPMYAEDCFKKALQYDENNASAWLWLASLANEKSVRVSYLDRVLSIDPENQAAANALNSIRVEEENSDFAAIKKAAIDGDAQTALASLESFNQLYPANVEAWMLRSHLVTKPADKLSALARLLEIDPENEAAKLSYQSLSSMFQVAEPPITVVPEHNGHSEDPCPETVEPTSDEDDEFTAPIAPPADALIFVPAESDTEIPDTLFVNAEDAEEIRASAYETDEPELVEDWDRETEAYDVSDLTEVDQAAAAIVDAEMAEAFETSFSIPMPSDVALAETALAYERTGFETTVQPEAKKDLNTKNCSFCDSANGETAFACGSCRAVLSLSELELLLANEGADKYLIRKAVERMEKEKKGRLFEEAELTILGIGHLNLRNLQYGFNYLQEASRLNPDNIVLAAQVNALHIRMEEIRQQEEAHAALVKGKNILVVDDSSTVRKLIAGKLEKSGHFVHCTASGDEAMEHIKGQVPDLILLDIAMPGMDGYQACRQIRGWVSTAKTPVVMISGKDGFFDKMRGRMAGATGHITKPFGPETLMKAVEFYLGGGTDMDPDAPVVETESVN